MDKKEVPSITTHPIPPFNTITTRGTLYALKTLGTGAACTIIWPSLGKFLIKSGLFLNFITTAKRPLDEMVHQKLEQYNQAQYHSYVPAATTTLSLIIASRFLYLKI